MATKKETILLSANDVTSLLTVPDCVTAVENGFRALGEGKLPAPELLSLYSDLGGLHVKAAVWMNGAHYFVAKANANFPSNPKTHGLPTIQGVIILCDADTGELLALIDSIEITALRTGAATAVAARKLARADSRVLTICGCGRQGQIQMQSLLCVLPIKVVYAYDLDPAAAQRFAAANQHIEVQAVEDLPDAIVKSDIVVTCTPARKFFIRSRDVRPGTFIAAVGADNELKQEIDPRLFVKNKIVVDSLAQCLKIGDLHHAVTEGFASESVHAELADVVAGRRPGRTSNEETTLFDSTGIAIEDAAAAALVYEKALRSAAGTKFSF